MKHILLMTCLTFVLSSGASATWKHSEIPDCSHLFQSENPAYALNAEAKAHYLQVMRSPISTEDEKYRARLELGLFTHEETGFLDWALNKAANRVTVDTLFEQSARGERPASSTTELAVLDTDQSLPAQLFSNIMEQVYASNLFSEFTQPKFMLSAQYLRIKPRHLWSPEAQRAFETVMYALSASDRAQFADSWIYGIFESNPDIMNFAGVPVVSFLMDTFPDTLKAMVQSPLTPPLSNRWMQTTLYESSQGPLVINRALGAAGYFPYRPSVRYSEGMGPSHLPGAFYLPVEVIDWENSFFEIVVTKKKPVQYGLTWEFPSVFMTVAKLGKEVVLTGANSGTLQKAAIRSQIQDHLPQHWNQVPEPLRRLPRNLAELNQYLKWLESVHFDSGSLNGSHHSGLIK